MTSGGLRQQLHRFRWPLGVAVLLLLYTLAGFLLLPWALKHFITGSLSEQWGRPVLLRDASFNPYRFYLQLDGLDVQDTGGGSLFALEQLRFDYEVPSVFRLEVGIEEFAIEKPFVKLDADGKGSYTLVNMLSAAGSDKAEPVQPDEQQDDDKALFPLLLRSLTIRDGTLLYRDQYRAGGFEESITLPSLSVLDFHTRQTERGNHVAVVLSNGRGGTVDLDAHVRVQAPLQVRGTVSCKNLDLLPVWRLLEMPVNFRLQPPTLDTSAHFDFVNTEPFSLQVTEGEIRLRNAVIGSTAMSEQEQAVIRLPLLAATDVNLSLPQQQVTVGKLLAADGWLDLVRDKQGVLNVQALFAPVATASASAAAAEPAAVPEPVAAGVAPVSAAAPVPEPAPAPESVPTPAPESTPVPASESVPAPTPTPEPAPAATPARPWDVLLKQVELSNYSVQFRDETPASPFVATLTPLSVNINEWKPLSAEAFAVQLKTGIAAAAVEQPGQLQLDSKVQLKPLLVDTHVDLQQLPLVMAQPYVQDAARLVISDGRLGAALDVHVAAAEAIVVDVKGSAEAQQLLINDQKGKNKLLALDKLAVSGLAYALQGNNLQIEQVVLSKLDSAFVINPDGSTNLSGLLVPQPAKSSTKSSAPLVMNIGAITLENADLGFADRSMKPNFKVAMQQLSGAIKGLSSDAKKPASFDLTGKVDRYAPVTIKGKFNAFASKPSFDAHMAFKNLELTTFTPYSGTYAGFRIARGQLSLDIDYKLVNNKIQGKNRIVMNQMQLGENVQSPRAVDLPLRLAIALLRDENGVIDLGFEVGGDLSDPQFSIGGIIWKVFSNMIMKVVTAPFNVLSALVPGADVEGLDQISFAVGDSRPDQAGVNKLQTVATMMQKRASLHIDVQGNVLPDQDRPALQQQALLASLQQGDDALPAEVFLSAAQADENGSAYKRVAKAYKTLNKESIGDLQDRIEEEREAKGEKTERTALRQLAYEQAFRSLQDSMVVTDEALTKLAMERAANIKDALVSQHGIAPERVFVVEANADPAKASLSSSLALKAN